MDSYKFIDESFLINLRNETIKSSPMLIESLFELYSESLPTKLSELEAAATERNFQSLIKIAHFLKGQSSCVGAHIFAEDFLKIESLAKKNNLAEISQIIVYIQRNVIELENEFKHFLKTK